MDHRFKGQVPLVGLKEPPIPLSFKHVFVVLGFLHLGRRIKGYQILVSVYAFAGADCDVGGDWGLDRIGPLSKVDYKS